MRRGLHFVVLCLAAALIAASPLDTAAIIGTSNGRHYEIIVRTDGLTTLYSGSIALRTFSLPDTVVRPFFDAVVAGSEDDVQDVDCSSVRRPVMYARVAWHGWYSADVTCMAKSAVSPIPQHWVKLNNVVMEVVALAGYPAAVHCWELAAGQQPPGCTHTE